MSLARVNAPCRIRLTTGFKAGLKAEHLGRVRACARTCINAYAFARASARASVRMRLWAGLRLARVRARARARVASRMRVHLAGKAGGHHAVDDLQAHPQPRRARPRAHDPRVLPPRESVRGSRGRDLNRRRTRTLMSPPALRTAERSPLSVTEPVPCSTKPTRPQTPRATIRSAHRLPFFKNLKRITARWFPYYASP